MAESEFICRDQQIVSAPSTQSESTTFQSINSANEDEQTEMTMYNIIQSATTPQKLEMLVNDIVTVADPELLIDYLDKMHSLNQIAAEAGDTVAQAITDNERSLPKDIATSRTAWLTKKRARDMAKSGEAQIDVPLPPIEVEEIPVFYLKTKVLENSQAVQDINHPNSIKYRARGALLNASATAQRTLMNALGSPRKSQTIIQSKSDQLSAGAKIFCLVDKARLQKAFPTLEIDLHAVAVDPQNELSPLEYYISARPKKIKPQLEKTSS